MNPSILVVDDEIIIARELEARLEGMGYEVAGIASSAGEAIRLAAERRPDLVLMDVVLKGEMDGIEAAGEIRRRYHLPVVYLTAYTDRDTLDRAKATEPFGYIVKPFSERELRANIEMALYKHRTEVRLRRLEQWFGTAIEEAADAVIVADRDGVITDFNTAAEEITAWDRDQAVGRRLEEVFRLVERNTGRPVSLDGAEEGPLVRLSEETRLLDRSDRQVPVDSTTSLIRDEGDRPTGIVSVFRDATGRRHGALTALSRDVALTAQALTLQGMLQACAEALVRRMSVALARIWTLDDSGATLVLQASAGMDSGLGGPYGRIPVGETLVGRTAEERRPHLTNDVSADPWVSDPESAERLGLVAFAGHPLVVGDRLVGVMALFSRAPLAPALVKELSAVADAIAVAVERKQAEEALRSELRRTSEKLARTTSASPAILYTMALTSGDGDPTPRPTWVSENVRRILGYDVHEALEPGWWASRLHPEDRDRALEANGSLLAAGQYAHEYRFLRRDGSVAWIRDHARLERDREGDEALVVGAWLDVTERHEVEEQLRQSQKMESVGRLAGGVAHDFNNLLTVVTGTTDLLLQDLPEGDPAREDLLEIRGAADRATALTRQLLAFSRKQVFQPRVVDLNATLEGMERMLQRLIREDIALVMKPGEDPGYVRVDPGQMEQVVLNLVVNARDAMPKGGTLTIETGRAVLDDAYARQHPDVTPGPHAMLAVSDTGTGMDEATRQQIFEPFFTTKGRHGTGLGLSTVYGIVKQSDGHVFVYSEPGIGTTFRIYLPLAGEPEPDDSDSIPTGTGGGSETILLIEDDAAVRELLHRVLESAGYEVLATDDPEEATAAATEHDGDIDLILTDVVMPDVHGPELARRILAARPETRVLYMSGYTPDAIAHHGVLAPDAHLIGKPFDLGTLTRRVRQVLDGET